MAHGLPDSALWAALNHALYACVDTSLLCKVLLEHPYMSPAPFQLAVVAPLDNLAGQMTAYACLARLWEAACTDSAIDSDASSRFLTRVDKHENLTAVLQLLQKAMQVSPACLN